jgi:hypothetical protein
MRRVLLVLAALLATTGEASAQSSIVFNSTLDTIFQQDGLFITTLTAPGSNPDATSFQAAPFAGAIASLTLGLACGGETGAGATCEAARARGGAGAVTDSKSIVLLLSDLALYAVGDLVDGDGIGGSTAVPATIVPAAEMATLSSSVSASISPARGQAAQGVIAISLGGTGGGAAMAGTAGASPDGLGTTVASFTLYDAALRIGSPRVAPGPEAFTITVPVRGRAVFPDGSTY